MLKINLKFNITILVCFLSFQLKDIKSLGCTKDDVSAATYRIYLDLCKVRQYEEVSYHYLPALDHLYLKAKKNQDEDEEVVVPFLTTQPFTFAGMEEFQSAFSSNSIKIAICDPSSTIIYYKISKSWFLWKSRSIN